MLPRFISQIDKRFSLISKSEMAWKSIRVLKNYCLRKEAVLRHYDRKFAVPQTLYLECTNVCNARCFFCAYPEIVGKVKPRFMDVPSFERVLTEFSEMGGESISLTPTLGDPLADRYFTERLSIIDQSTVKNIHFYTNLINYSDEVGRAMEALNRTELRVFVSIMGFDRESYKRFMGVDKFDTVCRNLERLADLPGRKKNIKVKVKVQDYRGDGEARSNFFGFLDKLGIPSNIGRRLDTWGGLVEDKVRAEGAVDVKTRHIRLGPCKVSYMKPVVTVDLKLKLCDCRDINNELEAGDLSGSTLAETWRGSRAREIRNGMRDRSRMPVICRKCELYTSIYDYKRPR